MLVRIEPGAKFRLRRVGQVNHPFVVFAALWRADARRQIRFGEFVGEMHGDGRRLEQHMIAVHQNRNAAVRD